LDIGGLCLEESSVGATPGDRNWSENDVDGGTRERFGIFREGGLGLLGHGRKTTSGGVTEVHRLFTYVYVRRMEQQ
jgi:hypothetical protein